MTDAGRIGSGLAGVPERVDLLVIGLGVTGAGVALDAATRGLSVLAVDAHDLAFGTSRWSSKLVHGGLRYLAQGQLGVAHESAVERGVLMEVTAPHLTHELATLVPLTSAVGPFQAGLVRAGLWGGDLLRRGARTSRTTLPAPRRISSAETRTLAPGLRTTGLRGGLLGWDGQLEDDARLVITIARTAAAAGAEVRTRSRVLRTTEHGVLLRDERTGETAEVAAPMVVNATGVWAGDLVDDVRLRPSRGSHLVLRDDALPGLRASLTVPVPGATNRFVMLLPQPDRTTYIGLTDEPAPGPVPDRPTPSEAEVDFLLRTASSVLAAPLTRSDVAGTYAGLRPLLRSGTSTSTADLSRRHVVLTTSTGPTRVVTVVGGKLTTYRRMAEDAVDAVLAAAHRSAGPCMTRRTPLTGAADREALAQLGAPARLVRRYGTDAALVLANAREVAGRTEAEVLAPVAMGVPVTLAELIFGVTHEGAVDVDDLLDRRTRVGLIAEDKELARPAAERALALAG